MGLLLATVEVLTQNTRIPPLMRLIALRGSCSSKLNTAAGGSNATFETWASDADTFKINPQFPTTPTLLAPTRRSSTALISRLFSKRRIASPDSADPSAGQESRRNRSAFDFIVTNNLYRVSGLKAAFGTAISFKPDAIEVKQTGGPSTLFRHLPRIA